MKNKALTVLVAVGMMVSLASATVLSKNGIAIDSATGLMWQDEPYTQVEEIARDKVTNNGKAGNWNYAKEYCENLTLDGFSDWRLPNIYELTTLVDNTKSKEPYVIDGIVNIDSYYYWASTASASYSSYAWNVGFYNGSGNTYDKMSSIYVRCVRAGQLNFHNLSLLKNKGKLKVSQENIDKISPQIEAKRKNETQTKNTTTQSYNTWTTGYKDKRIDSYLPSSYEATDIKCSDGIKGTVFNYYGRATSYRYIVNVTNSFASFDDAANYICGNK